MWNFDILRILRFSRRERGAVDLPKLSDWRQMGSPDYLTTALRHHQPHKQTSQRSESESLMGPFYCRKWFKAKWVDGGREGWFTVSQKKRKANMDREIVKNALAALHDKGLPPSLSISWKLDVSSILMMAKQWEKEATSREPNLSRCVNGNLG